MILEAKSTLRAHSWVWKRHNWPENSTVEGEHLDQNPGRGLCRQVCWLLLPSTLSIETASSKELGPGSWMLDHLTLFQCRLFHHHNWLGWGGPAWPVTQNLRPRVKGWGRTWGWGVRCCSHGNNRQLLVKQPYSVGWNSCLFHLMLFAPRLCWLSFSELFRGSQTGHEGPKARGNCQGEKQWGSGERRWRQEKRSRQRGQLSHMEELEMKVPNVHHRVPRGQMWSRAASSSPLWVTLAASCLAHLWDVPYCSACSITTLNWNSPYLSVFEASVSHHE